MEDYLLLHSRAKLVKKYRQNKNLWPDGIDHEGNRWYGDGSDWPDDKVELMSSVKWYEDRLSGRTPVTLKGVTKSVTPPPVTQIEPSKADLRRLQAKARIARLRAKRRLAAANPDLERKSNESNT